MKYVVANEDFSPVLGLKVGSVYLSSMSKRSDSWEPVRFCRNTAGKNQNVRSFGKHSPLAAAAGGSDPFSVIWPTDFIPPQHKKVKVMTIR